MATPSAQESVQNAGEIKTIQNPSTDCENLSWLSTNEYEPPVQKRVQVEKPALPQLTPSASKQNEQTPMFGLNLKAEKLDSNTTPGVSSLFPSLSQVRSGNTPSSELAGMVGFSGRKVGKEPKEELELGSVSQIDQTKLLKRINKVLDENMALKQHLEVCQKIISIYQANLGEIKDPSLV